MTSLHAVADSIRAAVESTSTCTPATATTLNDLLLPKTHSPNIAASKPIPKSTVGQNGRSGKAALAKTRGKKVACVDEKKSEHAEQLSAKERSILATEVINATLKALSEAIKAPAPRKKDSSKGLVKASAREVLRRSNSMPQSPLQTRSLNRILSSPEFSSRHNRSAPPGSIASPGPRSTAECARIAFACLRTLQAGKVPGVNLPPLQLENGMSVLIAKLVSLGLDDLAIKEIKILKRRLDPGDSKTKKAGNAATAPQSLNELLDFGKGDFPEANLGLVIITQLQILKLLASSRKHRLIESALPFLQLSYPSSPTCLLLLAAKGTLKPDKCVRQLLSLSEILLSLSPSVSTSDDATALEPRLNVAPEVALHFQILALHNRSLWWQLAGHKGDTTKDLIEPFLRCLSAFARRTQDDARESYKVSLESFLKLKSILSDLGETDPWPRSNLTGIYKILSGFAREANRFDDAIDWMKKIKGLLDSKTDSDVKRCCIEARLVGLTLRTPSRQPEDEEILLALLEGLEQPFKGDSSEIDDLMTEVSSARRAAITILASRGANRGTAEDLTQGMREMCESLVLLCPRLCLRYLGNSPSGDSVTVTKDIVRREQRRQFITKPGHSAIDSVLFLVKTLLAEGSLTWDLMDSKLQDCTSLLDRLDDNGSGGTAECTASTASYYVKISNLYYSQYLNMYRDCKDSKDVQLVRVLRRSIDCIRTRSQQEKMAASLPTKLERLAEVYKATGRYDELFKTLLSLREEMIGNGVLQTVTAAAATMRFQAAWTDNEETLSLVRTMKALLKLHFKYHEPTQDASLLKGDWTTDERATILEQYLEIMSSQSDGKAALVIFRKKVFDALLSIYNRREYPLRRLRVLIRLLSLDVDSRDNIVDDIGAELDALRLANIDIENSKDVGLREYHLYLSTLASSTLELQQEEPSIDTLKHNLVIWSSIRRGSGNLEALQCQIEDVPGLVTHLQSVADYMQLMGFESIRLATLKLIADYNELHTELPDDLVRNFCNLASQWLHLGYSGKAGLALDRAQNYSCRNGISTAALLQLHLSCSQYLFQIGNYDKSEEHLHQAHTIFITDEESEFRRPSTFEQRNIEKQLLSDAYLVQSMLALEHGGHQTALMYAKQSLRLLRRAWVNLQEHERQSLNSSCSSVPRTETDKLADEISNLNLSTIKMPTSSDEQQWTSGTAFWTLIAPLFRAMSYLSNIHAHHGMFQETLYYAEQAHKLVQEVGAKGLKTIASDHLGSIWLKAGRLDKGSELLMAAAQANSTSGDQNRDSAILAYHLGEMHSLLGDRDAEMEAYRNAEATVQKLTEADFISRLDCLGPPDDDLEQRMGSLIISEAKVAAPRKVVAKPKKVAKKKTTVRPKSPVALSSSVVEECPQLLSFKANVLRQKAQAITATKNFADALPILNEAGHYSKSRTATLEQGLAMAKHLLLQSIDQMHADPVYSVLQESTISFPSIICLLKLDRNSGDRLLVAKTSPTSKKLSDTKGRRDLISRSKSPVSDNFFDNLRQAQEHLTEVYSMALTIAPVAKIHTISALLNSVAILLSASGQIKGKPLAHPGFASCSIETARSIALRRERKAIMANNADLKDSAWPSKYVPESKRSSLAPSVDMSRFQRDYIDIIPKTWTAISIALSDSRNELSITKLEAGYSPFVLRLPLGRNNSIDADEEVFGFEQGLSEMLEIIQLADDSARGSGELKGREAKNAWWAKRTALDSRLRDLLENIEKVWLGGFTGIFSQHSRRPDLVARFQKSFQNILDRHLPSRRKTKRSTSPRITLDSRILDLFIGLGDASDENSDLSEPLTDLLYFVVDVLQFHGELNAYAEVDFDSIVVETHDALRGYHEAVKAANLADEGRHTILILDKALHAFPWESLPCMDGLAVSRLPSLGSLRDRIIEQQNDIPEDSPPGHYIDRNNGSYIMNPEGDLKNTQATFEKPLQNLKEWHKVVARKPSEDEIKSDLESKDIMLYFGHGSGAQFIRAREIRKLEKCAVTMLMGCSSGALKETGEFEPFGPPINYMHAGSPALVATLWDVTDKDIDRFFQSTFEHWGLFDKQEAQVRRNGKGKEKEKSMAEVKEEKRTSLVEAVVGSRQACILPFLNAAAVVVYGVPVYIR
ncbi:Separase [Hyphodiscus hymeniophilus]|uniref:separase n=1 Tax=Hyphodiscus hymeniophilus TaxID=353542 RepID=A0A9P7AUG8_9HELO|nr:Separase [Hyphodiscus hymeniophilus]